MNRSGFGVQEAGEDMSEDVMYGEADLLVRLKNDRPWKEQVGKALILAGEPKHLRKNPTIWLTSGSCQRTLGSFRLARAPYKKRGVLSVPGKNDPRRENAVWLDVGKVPARDQFRSIGCESQAGRPPAPGAFVYVRSVAAGLLILHNPEQAAPQSRSTSTRLMGTASWTPIDVDLIDERESVRSTAEERLLEQYQESLGRSKSRWRTWSIRVDDELAMRTDLFDVGIGAVIEAKGHTGRGADGHRPVARSSSSVAHSPRRRSLAEASGALPAGVGLVDTGAIGQRDPGAADRSAHRVDLA